MDFYGGQTVQRITNTRRVGDTEKWVVIGTPDQSVIEDDGGLTPCYILSGWRGPALVIPASEMPLKFQLAR